MSKEKQIEKEIEEMAHSLRIRKLDNEKIGFDVLSRLTGNSYEDEETSIARHIITQLGYRKQSEWISVEERLPDTTEKILVYCSNGEILPAKYIRVQGLEFWFEETYSCHNITHWMPLPPPPKENKND